MKCAENSNNDEISEKSSKILKQHATTTNDDYKVTTRTARAKLAVKKSPECNSLKI